MKTPFFAILLSAVALLWGGPRVLAQDTLATADPVLVTEPAPVMDIPVGDTVLVIVPAGVPDSLAALYSWTPGELRKKGTRLALGKQKLPKNVQTAILADIGGLDLNPTWRKNTTLFWTGLGLTIGGGVGTGVAFCYGGIYILAGCVATIFVAPFGSEAVQKMWDDIGAKASVGSYIGLGTTAVMATGIVLLCVGNHNLRKTVKYCNAIGARQVAYFDFGGTASGGLGVTFNF